MADEFQAQWRERLSSGSKLAPKALAQAIKEDATRIAAAAALCSDSNVNVRVAALRGIAMVARDQPAFVAPHARPIIEALAAPEPDAQEAALDALGHIASLAPEASALALPLISDLLEHAKRPAIREEAARCIGKIGGDVPQSAAQAAQRLASHLGGLKTNKSAQEARETLAALEAMLQHLTNQERAALAARVTPLRSHPNIQVRERAGRIARMLAA